MLHLLEQMCFVLLVLWHHSCCYQSCIGLVLLHPYMGLENIINKYQNVGLSGRHHDKTAPISILETTVTPAHGKHNFWMGHGKKSTAFHWKKIKSQCSQILVKLYLLAFGTTTMAVSGILPTSHSLSVQELDQLESAEHIRVLCLSSVCT